MHNRLHRNAGAGCHLKTLEQRDYLPHELIVKLVAENAQSSAHGDLLGNDVVRRSADDLAEGQQCVLMRIDIARYDRLDHRYKLSGDNDGVNAHLRR